MSKRALMSPRGTFPKRICSGRTAPVRIGSIFTEQGRSTSQRPNMAGSVKRTVTNSSVDPLDDVFQRFCEAKKNTSTTFVDEMLDSHTELVETARHEGPSLNESELILIDDDEDPDTGRVLETNDNDLDIICIDDEIEAAREKTIINIDEDEITILDDEPNETMEDDAITCIQHSASSSISEFTIDKLGRIIMSAALEDSLVKAAAQQHQKYLRSWERVRDLKRSLKMKDEIIRCCTYNILCQDTITRTRYLYRHLTRELEDSLAWDNRWPLLSQNLDHINADIFALQEVQDSHFDNYINPLLTQKGYGSMFTKKTEGFCYRDGCALFYKRDKFDYVFSRAVQYFCGKGTSLDKPQIGQILRLRCKKTNKEIVVANTHIIFNMKRGDIKLGQLSLLFAHIHAEMTEHGHVPLILMGDFNMDPLSQLYSFVTRGSIFLKGLPRSSLASNKDKSSNNIVDADKIIPPCSKVGRNSMFVQNSSGLFSIFGKQTVPVDTITHPFELWSAYAPLHGRHVIEEVSTYHADHGNPDFIFYSVRSKEFGSDRRTIHDLPTLRLFRRVTLPTLADCRDTLGPWPNPYVPSDHIPLICEFQLRGDA